MALSEEYFPATNADVTPVPRESVHTLAKVAGQGDTAAAVVPVAKEKQQSSVLETVKRLGAGRRVALMAARCCAARARGEESKWGDVGAAVESKIRNMRRLRAPLAHAAMVPPFQTRQKGKWMHKKVSLQSGFISSPRIAAPSCGPMTP